MVSLIITLSINVYYQEDLTEAVVRAAVLGVLPGIDAAMVVAVRLPSSGRRRRQLGLGEYSGGGGEAPGSAISRGLVLTSRSAEVDVRASLAALGHPTASAFMNSIVTALGEAFEDGSLSEALQTECLWYARGAWFCESVQPPFALP